MSTAMMPRPSQAASRFEQREVIDTIKQTVCRGASDAQLKMFLEVCKATGLDPFLKEIWFVAEKNIIMAGRDGYLRVANEHPMFDGMETRVERDANKIPVKAICTVWRKDRNHPITCEAYYNEYKKGSPVWTQYPSAMIGKVAEVLALKRSFSINGVVTEEEIGNPGEEKQARQEAKQAAQDVALAKIAAMKSGKSYAEVSEAEPVEVVDAEPVTEEIAQSTHEQSAIPTISGFRASGKKGQIEAFGMLKQSIGEQEYYRILGIFGAEHANEFRTLGEATKAYGVMLATYQQNTAVSA